MNVKLLFKDITLKNLLISSSFILLIIIFNIYNIIFNSSNVINIFNSLSSIFLFILIITFTFNFNEFKISIQNGVSRKTFWKSKIYSIFFVGFIANLFSSIILFMYYKFDSDNVSSYYIENYFGFFNNSMLNIFFMFTTGLIAMILFILFFNTFGTFMSLFSAKLKFIIYLILCSSFVGFIVSMNQKVIFNFIYRYLFDSDSANWQFLRYINGMDAQNTNENNPIHIIITMIIIICITLFINYRLTKLQQVNR